MNEQCFYWGKVKNGLRNETASFIATFYFCLKNSVLSMCFECDSPKPDMICQQYNSASKKNIYRKTFAGNHFLTSEARIAYITPKVQ